MLMYILIAVTGLQDPRTNLKQTKSVHCRKSFIKNVAQIIDSETPRVIIIIIVIEVQGPASVLWLVCFSVDQLIFFILFYLQLSQFSLKLALMVSGVIGSIPCGHLPASSGQTNSGTVTAKLQAIQHWSQWTLAFTWFLFLLLDPFGIAYS